MQFAVPRLVALTAVVMQPFEQRQQLVEILQPDNVRLDKQTLAPSNAALVNRAVEICRKYNRPIATWREARKILGLRPPNA